MKRKELFDTIVTELSSVYNTEEARAITSVLFAEFYALQRHDIFLYPDLAVGNNEILENAVEELKRFRPLQYVLGKAWLCDFEFRVKEGVLIPRPETEELINWIVAENNIISPQILDIGTGSGCIAVSLAKLILDAKVSGIDISPEALNIATENAKHNGTEITFSRCDILNESPSGCFDIIVSNPPYVLDSEKQLMRRNVLDYEPHIALFAPNHDKLMFYKYILNYAKGALYNGGKLYFEINENYGAELIKILEENGFHDIVLRKDIFDKERMIRAIWS